MATKNATIHRYISGQPYRLAAGRDAPCGPVVDHLTDHLAVIALDIEKPSAMHFMQRMHQEMKIRFYTRRTVKSYLASVRSLLRWFGRAPHLLAREHVRRYLEYLVDAGQSASSISVALSAIRTTWDKMCFRDVTLGLATPRRPRQRFVVCSREEVCTLLAAAPSRRDKLLIGLMYGAGLRVSEVTRLRWCDIDADRQQIFVQQGKGNADRHVQLPIQYRDLLTPSAADTISPSGTNRKSPTPSVQGADFIFRTESGHRSQSNRHLSPRTVQRILQRACRVGGLKKQITPHSLRHAFATHSFEQGCDIRRIQKVLGHVRLETTTLYVHVAKEQTNFPSPLDQLHHRQPNNATTESSQPRSQTTTKATVGRLRLHHRRDPSTGDATYRAEHRTQFTIELIRGNRREFLTGIVAHTPRPGLVTIEIPPIEQWKPIANRLGQAVVSRIQEAEFYEIIQQLITRRMLCLSSIPSSQTAVATPAHPTNPATKHSPP
ncbi:Tyrosine recombinase XerD [Rubripirellula tenax]|uniref:Tyrosine recombinase XerD n=1 Tax=Rubripirellula tenax TaxID=2528015 RepID=A0A5C6ENX4_9BACT|nr:tyrosine-type recombinase/integrase [Rubripirellula tenax]TWU50762.1 Tyrosine recombinase XerD [Rubripirellula tenax]